MVDHGYSLLRTQLNNDYFLELFDESARFQIPIEGHRKYKLYLPLLELKTALILLRHRNGPRCPRNSTGVYFSTENGG
jgi:hypothetical protein